MRRLLPLLLIALLLVGCDPVLLMGVSNRPTGNQAASQAPAGSITGTILQPDGLPAQGVNVKAYLATVAPLTTVAPLQQAAAGYQGRRVQATSVEAVTDAQGRFTLTSLPEGALNLEAVYSEAMKVFKRDIATLQERATDLGSLTLQPTGHLKGSVRLKDEVAGVSYQGVEVYIPGSSYLAKADAAGRFTLSNVAAGTFNLAAEKPGTAFGKGHLADVEVKPNQTVTTPDVVMTLTPPVIAALNPPHAGPGAVVTIQGEHFGASTLETLQVAMGGSVVTAPTRVDDRTIRFKVPENARSGDVLVTIGGIQSNPTRLRVVANLTITPKFRGATQVRRDQTKQLEVEAADTEGQPIENPVVTWSVEEGNSLTVTNGLVTPTSNGDTLVKASSGTLFDDVLVHVFEIYGVTMEPTSFRLQPPPPEDPWDESRSTATVSITFHTSDDGNPDWIASRYLDFASSDAERVTFEDDWGTETHPNIGKISVYPGAAPGEVVVTVSAYDDPRYAATASVLVEAAGSP